MGRLAYDAGANPFSAILFRLAALVMVVGLVIGALRRPVRLDPRTLAATLWMAGTLSLVSLGYLGSVAFIPVSLAALLFYTYPLMVGVIATLAGRDRMTPGKAVALVSAFAGLALALGPGVNLLDWRGITLALLAALGMALATSFGREAVGAADPLLVNLCTNVWLLLGIGGYVAIAGDLALPSTRLGILGLVGVCISYVGGYLSWFYVLRLLNPVQLGAIFNIEPLVSIVAAWVVLGERLAPVQVLGAALVLGAVASLARVGRRGNELPSAT